MSISSTARTTRQKPKRTVVTNSGVEVTLPKYVYYKRDQTSLGAFVALVPGYPKRSFSLGLNGGARKALKLAKSYIADPEGGARPAPMRIVSLAGAIKPWEVRRPVLIKGELYHLPQYVYWHAPSKTFVVFEATFRSKGGVTKRTTFKPENYGGIAQALREATYHLQEVYDPANYSRPDKEPPAVIKHLKDMGVDVTGLPSDCLANLKLHRTGRKIHVIAVGAFRLTSFASVDTSPDEAVPSKTTLIAIQDAVRKRRNDGIRRTRELLQGT